MTGPLGALRVPVRAREISLYLVFVSQLIGVPARAGGIQVDFSEAVLRAMKNNPYLSAAGHEWTAAIKDAEAARGNLLPSLFFEERFVRTNIPSEAFAIKINQERLTLSDFASADNFNNPSPLNDYMTVVTLEQPLFAPKAYLGYRMAKREARAKEREVLRKKEEIVFQVLSSCLDVRTAGEQVRVAMQGAGDAREHLRIAEAAERSGRGLASDVLRAKVFLASAESGQVTAENRLSLAKRGLALAMGEGRGTEAEPSGPLPPLPDEGSLDEHVAAAIAARSDLGALALRVENAGSNVTFQRSEYLPTVGITGAYQWDGQEGVFSPDNRTWKVGVGLKWSVFDGFRREASIARAAAERERAKAFFRGAQDQAVFQATQAYLSAKEAGRRVTIARSAADAAEEGVRLIRARYENQLARMIDLLDAQTALNSARADLVKAENDLQRSRAELLYQSGTLLPWALPRPEEKQ